MKQIQHVFFIFFISISTLLHAEAIRIMPLGDSITFDWNFLEMDNPRPDSVRSAYRNYLWYKLQDAKYDIDFVGSRITGSAIVPSFDMNNEGYTGYTSYQIAELVYNKLLQNPTDIILLHIGTNDWSSSVAGVTQILDEINRYEENFNHHITVVLARIINTKSRYIHITDFNINLQALADTRINGGDDIVVVDMEYGAGLDYSSDFIDTYHPNDVGYYKMATVWFNALNDMFQKKDDYSFLIPVYSSILN